VPLARWQSRQWQVTVATGALEHSYRTAPHAQPPENFDGTFTSVPHLRRLMI